MNSQTNGKLFDQHAPPRLPWAFRRGGGIWRWVRRSPPRSGSCSARIARFRPHRRRLCDERIDPTPRHHAAFDDIHRLLHEVVSHLVDRLHVEEQRLAAHNVGVGPDRRLRLADDRSERTSMLSSVSISEIERRWNSSASFSVFSCSLKRSCIYIAASARPHMRRVAVQQRAALQIVLHQEKPDRSIEQSVQSIPQLRSAAVQRNELAGLQRFQVPRRQQIEVALRLEVSQISASQPRDSRCRAV